MMIIKGFIKSQGNRIFLLVIIGLSFVAFNCAPTNKTYHLDNEMYFLSKKDAKELKKHWVKSTSLSTRTKIVHELANRKDSASLLYLLDYAEYMYTFRINHNDLDAFKDGSRSKYFRIQSVLIIIKDLKDFKERKVIEALIKMMTKFINYEIREQAIETLGYIKDPDTMEPIFDVLYDSNPNIRIKAIKALGEIGNQEAISRISILLADKNRYVQNVAELALRKLGVPEEEIADWKIKAEQLTIEDVYHAKLAYRTVVKEKIALKEKLDTEMDIKRQLESSLEDRESVTEKQQELLQSLYEKERQLKSKNLQLELAIKQSDEYKKELEALSNRADEMNKKLKFAESEVSSAGVKKELDEILKEKSKLEEEANTLNQRELRLRNEVSSLNSVAEKTRIEADKAKREISLMRMREAQLAGQIDELKKRLNRGMAPVLVVSKPKNGLKIDSPYVMLHLIAVDDKGISKTDVILNNVPISLDSDRGIKVTAADKSELPKKIDITKRLQLQNGQNTIKVAVVDTDGITTEEVITIVREKEHGDIWAIVIGINQYQNTRNLKYAVNDATSFNNYLNEYIGIPEEKIYFLTDQNATKNNIESILGTQIKRKASKGDTVIIFYAGHGAVETDPSNPDGDGFEKYLLPYDADLDDLYTTSISMDDIEKIFQRIRAERLIFIADTCYSGASGGRTMLASKTRANLSEKFFERISKGKGRVIISSCSANEVSKEDDELKHGIFSYHLLEGLKGKADHDTDGIITVSELFSFLSREVPDATGQDQHPVRKGETEGELVIGRVK